MAVVGRGIVELVEALEGKGDEFELVFDAGRTLLGNRPSQQQCDYNQDHSL
jgi:hypothetical protein